MFLAQTLPFVHPGLAGAALAAGLLPVLVHLINRRRHRRVPWAAMRFLLAAHRRSAKRVWIEQILLMTARIALVVLLGLALARPYTPANALVPVSSARVHRVLILDNSLSMNASGGGGPTRFEIAADYAAQLLASFPQGDPVSLVTTAAPAEALIAHAAYDRRFVRERLSGVGSTERSADIVGAIGKAREIVRESETPEGNQAVYLLSDMPRRVWEADAAEGDAPALVALRQLQESLGRAGHALNVIRVPTCAEEPADAPEDAAPCAIENVAITGLDVDTPLLAVGLPVRVSVTVTNTGSVSNRNITVQVRRDGQIVREEPVPQLAPEGSRLITLSTQFSRPGTHVLEARVVAARKDALVEDDARYISVDVRESIPVLLVDGRPGTTLLTGEAGFLATALAPDAVGRVAALARSAPGLAVVPTVVPPSDLAGESLDHYDVVALCNVARLSEADWTRLSQYIVNGGGLMIFGGDLIDPEHYNVAGAAVVPGTLGRTVQAAGAGLSSSEPGYVESAGVAFAAEALVHPIVADFADHPTSSLFLARIDRYLSIDPNPQHAEVIMRYANGDPAIVVSSRGEGSVVFFTTTADMDWTNLPAKGDFVSLVFNAVAFLAREHGQHRNVLVGQVIREPLTAAESSMEILVTTPSGAAPPPAVEPEGDGLSMRFGPVEQSGVVTASIAGRARQFVANVDPQESAVVPLTEGVLRNRLEGPLTVVTARGTPGTAEEAGALARRSAPYNELASLFAYAALALLLIEVWMAARFGAPTHVKAEAGRNAGVSSLPFTRIRRDESTRVAIRS